MSERQRIGEMAREPEDHRGEQHGFKSNGRGHCPYFASVEFSLLRKMRSCGLGIVATSCRSAMTPVTGLPNNSTVSLLLVNSSGVNTISSERYDSICMIAWGKERHPHKMRESG